MSAKLYSGGGDGIDHSSDRPSHGVSTSACGSRGLRCVKITVTKKMSTERADMNDPMVSMKFRTSQPIPGWYRYVRRGMPMRPTMCIGKKVRLKPMSISQKFHLPRRSSSILPNAFGHQKYKHEHRPS